MGGSAPRQLVELDVLGPVRVAVDGAERALAGPRKPRLLARLVVAQGRPVSAWELREDVWPDGATSDSTLRVAIARLRAVLGDDGPRPRILRHDANGYLLDPDAVVLDANSFRDLVDEARKAAHDPRRAETLYRQALELWRGTPYDDLPFATAEAERLRSLRDAAVEERLAMAVAAGGGPEILAELEAAVSELPLREQRTASLMLALYRAGRQADALAAYRRLEATLREGLGLSPGEDLRQLEVRIVSQDPGLFSRAEVAGRAPGVDRALGRSRAALALAQRGVFEEAQRLAASAVDEARTSGDPVILTRCLVSQARVHAGAAHPVESGAAADEAITIARRTGDGNGQAAAAMVRFGFGVAPDDTLIINLLEPLDVLPVDAPFRAELLCAAMHQVALTGTPGSAGPLVREAIQIAERAHDPRAQTVVRIGEAVLAGLCREPADVMRDLAEAALASADESGDPVLVVAALHAVARERVSAGDIDGLEALLPRFDKAAAAALMPFALVRRDLLPTTIGLARGDLVGLDAQIERAATAGVRFGVSSAAGSALAQRVLLMVERGDFDQVVAILSVDRSGARLTAATMALALAELGRHDEARARLDEVFADWDLHRGGDHLVIGALAAEAASLSGWPESGLVGDIVDPFAGRAAVFSYGTLSLGPVDRVLGLLALARGCHDEAVASMRAAVVVAGSAALWADRAKVGLAHALATRAAGADLEEARSLLVAVAGSPRLQDGTGSGWLRAQHGRATAALGDTAP